jgi:phosphotransferase system HPr-like phosphotransfer protein
VRGPLGFATGFATTPVTWMLAQHGIFWQAQPPQGAPSLQITVRDVGGLTCDAALYIFAALRDLEASVWVTRRGVGTIHLIDRGRTTRSAETLSARFPKGAELTITASGPDSAKALEVVREMLEAHPMDRRDMYRYLRKERT